MNIYEIGYLLIGLIVGCAGHYAMARAVDDWDAGMILIVWSIVAWPLVLFVFLLCGLVRLLEP